MPMKPAPAITSRRPGTSCARRRSASASVRRTWTPGPLRPGRLARPGAGGEHERVPADGFSGCPGELLRNLDPFDSRAEEEGDVIVLPVGRGLEVELAAGAGKELLGERGPLVGRMALLADQRDLAVEALGAERLRAAAAGEPRAEDEHAAGHQAAWSTLCS